MKVEVAWVGREGSTCVTLELAPGARVADALAASGLLRRSDLPAEPLVCALYGRTVTAERPLVDGVRVEITRPLVADPATRRRLATKKVRGPR